jgi:hypothetical protein
MGKKGKAQRKPARAQQQQATRPGQDAFGEADERSAMTGQSQRSDAFGEAGERSMPGRAQGQRGKQRSGQKGSDV